MQAQARTATLNAQLKHPKLWRPLGSKTRTWASGARMVWAGCRNPATTMPGHASAIRSSEAVTDSAARCSAPLRSLSSSAAAAPAASSSAAQWVAQRVRACMVATGWTLRRETKQSVPFLWHKRAQHNKG